MAYSNMSRGDTEWVHISVTAAGELKPPMVYLSGRIKYKQVQINLFLDYITVLGNRQNRKAKNLYLRKEQTNVIATDA